MDGIIAFMNGPWGRAGRVTVGLLLVAYGLVVLGGIGGIVVTILGLAFVALGTVGRCLLELVRAPQVAS